MEQYSSENSDVEEGMLKTLDLSHNYLDYRTLFNVTEQLNSSDSSEQKAEHISTLIINHNILTEMPENISNFSNLRKLDISNNSLTRVPEVLNTLPLKSLIAKHNNFTNNSLPKSMEGLSNTLEELNLSANNLNLFPEQLFDLIQLKYLYLGENKIEGIPFEIHKLNRLEILSLGRNELTEVPKSLCQLNELKALILSDNHLESLPACIANLKKLRTLQLHRNKLKTLPTEIVTLKYLTELSLRENPLIDKFVNDMIYDPPTLEELSARVIKLHNIKYNREDLPKNVYEYLNTAHHCVNPNCKGVYFDNRVEHIKFVDFCGKYRVPLLQYLCSSKCIDYSGEEEEDNANASNDNLMRKVLLG